MYIRLCKNIKNKHAEIWRSLDKSNQKVMDTSKDKLNYKAKIMDDSQLISDLNE
jgi:hypothetical protein